jgi:hypothetical protein
MKTYKEFEQLFKDKGYRFFKGDLNLNLFAIRKKINTNLFDDAFYVVYEKDGIPYVKEWACTTDAGVTYLKKPINPNGTAIIVPGQYRGAYGIGRHTSYEALRQAKPMNYYRDNDRDLQHDLAGKIYSEIGFTNIHKAGKDSAKIDNWSAGCIVLKRERDFNELMELARASAKKYGNSFTFTLFEQL